MIPTQLYTLLKAANSIRSMTSQQLINTLEGLHDAEYNAAIRAFRDAESSTNPTRELAMGITLLRGVYEKSLTLVPNRSKRLFIPFVNMFVMEPANVKAGARAVAISFLLTAYYSSVKERKLRKTWANNFQSTFELFSHWYIDYVSLRSNQGVDPLSRNQQEKAIDEARAELIEAKNQLDIFMTKHFY